MCAGGCVVHAACTTQEVKAFTSFEIFSDLTSLFTRIRHPIMSLSPWDIRLPNAVALLTSFCHEHGRVTFLTNLGVPSTSK